MGAEKKQRIAVLGGGIGALSAAFYLTEQPGWQDKYEITVYQQGWRLGGKCASGHDMRPGYGNRIYEHGLHIFAGWYDQAFQLLRLAYDEIARPKNHPNCTLWQAFTPQDTITLMDLDMQGLATLPWLLDFSPNYDVPGNSLAIPPLAELIHELLGALLHYSASTHTTPHGGRGAAPAPVESPLQRLWEIITGIIQKIKDDIQDMEVHFALRAVVSEIENYARAQFQGQLGPAGMFQLNRALMAIYLAQTMVRGIAEDHVMEKGYDAIDHYEWSEWLYKHALEVAKLYPEWGNPQDRARDLITWVPMSSLYDYAFAYRDGDPSKPYFGAGTALRAGLLMISYKGHFFYRMRGAMGDVVIAPVYLALLKRGVKFNFFSRITALNIDDHADTLASIDYVEQVRLKDPAAGYKPLVDVPVPGWDVPLEGWPIEPLWEQLDGGEALKQQQRDFESDHLGQSGAGDIPRRLTAGIDFDKAIVGISVGGLKEVCASFPARLPHSKWGEMFDALTLSATCAMQIWTRRTVSDMGSDNSDRTLTGAAQPYSSWSDMSHLLGRENWRGEERPMGVIYFCGQILDANGGHSANEQAYDAAVSWLKSNTVLYWTEAFSDTSPYGLDPSSMFDPEPEAGGDVLKRQYIRANVNPSDLYVQSPPKSVHTRMDADQSGLPNLFLAGDWTLNGLNSGCAESAARSGWRCAQAIAGTLPPLA